MKSRIGCAQVFLLLLASSILNGQPAKMEMSPADKAEIVRLEDGWLKAIEAADTTALGSILAEDFVRPAPATGRFITKSQLLDYYKSHKSQTPAAKHIEDLNVTLYGTTAIARGNVVTTDNDGHVASKNLFTDVFVYRNGHWQAVSAQENDASPH